MKTRPELDSALDALAQQLPAMIAAHPDDADFWPAFAGVADEIADNAGALDCDHVHTRLDAMLGCRGGHQ
jgi:hypothetical protein